MKIVQNTGYKAENRMADWQTFLTICSEVVTVIFTARSMAGANISCIARSIACLTQLFRWGCARNNVIYIFPKKNDTSIKLCFTDKCFPITKCS